MRDLRRNIINFFKNPFVDKKVQKTILYFYLALGIFIVVLVMFSYEYIGSAYPIDLLHSKTVNYTYAGTPDYANVYSSYLNIGIGGTNNTQSDLTVYGASKMALHSTGVIKVKYDDRVVDRTGSIEVYTVPGSEVDIQVTVTKEDAYPHGMRMIFNDTAPDPDKINESNMLKIMRQNNDQYLIIARFAPGSNKSFDVKGDGRYDFPIMISSSKNMRIIDDSSGEDIKSIEFSGELNITTDSEMMMNVPASSITGAAGYMVKLVHSDGSLDVRHGEYKCNRADNITIKPANTSRNTEPKYVNGNTHVLLMNGHILAYGQAETLEFREHNFNWPIYMLIKEGKLPLFTGLLGSLFTLVMTRLISRFKKKND